jgi:hypothetical protein
MEWLAENWMILFVLFVVAYFAITWTIRFLREPSKDKIKNIKEWLKWAVAKAEKELGSGTGQLKLRMVYDMAIDKFPFIVKFVSFETFSKWVDEALDWMNYQLDINKNINNLIIGGNDGSESTVQ